MEFRVNYFFGPNESSHHMMVHELTEAIELGRVYYSVDSTSYDPVSVIDSTFMISNKDTLLSFNLNGLKDELFDAVKDFEADSAGFADFLEQFKGFTLISGSSSNAVLGFSNSSPDSKIVLYYTCLLYTSDAADD